LYGRTLASSTGTSSSKCYLFLFYCFFSY